MANENKELNRNHVLSELKKFNKDNGVTTPEADLDKKASQTIGNNGYTLGQEFTLTGKCYPKMFDINGKKTSSYVLETEEGLELSVSSIMGLSSLNHYLTEGSLMQQYALRKPTQQKPLKEEEIHEEEISAEVVTDFDFSLVYQPKSRNLFDFIAYILGNEAEFKGKKLTYLGKVIRKTEAKKSYAFGNTFVEPTFVRVMSSRLWSLE